MVMCSDYRPRLAPTAHLEWDQVMGRHLLVYPDAALALGETAPEVLRLCDGERTLQDIIGTLATEYEGSPAVVAEDVRAFVAALRVRGLLVEPGLPGG